VSTFGQYAGLDWIGRSIEGSVAILCLRWNRISLKKNPPRTTQAAGLTKRNEFCGCGVRDICWRPMFGVFFLYKRPEHRVFFFRQSAGWGAGPIERFFFGSCLCRDITRGSVPPPPGECRFFPQKTGGAGRGGNGVPLGSITSDAGLRCARG